jgi:hypothetical protein
MSENDVDPYQPVADPFRIFANDGMDLMRLISPVITTLKANALTKVCRALALALLALLLPVSVARGQDQCVPTPEVEDLRAQIVALQEQLAALRAEREALVTPTATSALATTAAAMGAGEWRELATLNATGAFAATGASLITHPWSDGMVWSGGAGWFIGGDHGDLPSFIRYDEAQNAWAELPKPFWFPTSIINIMHGLDHTAVDRQGGRLFHHPYNSYDVWQYTIATGAWNHLPLPPVDYNVCCVALEYVPGFGLIYVAGGESILNYVTSPPTTGGGVFRFNEATRLWERLAANLPMSDQPFARYNPVDKLLFFGGGVGIPSRAVYKMDAGGVVTRLRDAPMSMGVTLTTVTNDPVSGAFIVLTMDGEWWTYAIATDTWTKQTTVAPPLLQGPAYYPYGTPDPVFSILATPVPEHGVMLFVKSHYSTGSKVYLYRHAGGTGSPPPNCP